MNNMEKKEYIKPEMTVYQIKAPTISPARISRWQRKMNTEMRM